MKKLLTRSRILSTAGVMRVVAVSLLVLFLLPRGVKAEQVRSMEPVLQVRKVTFFDPTAGKVVLFSREVGKAFDGKSSGLPQDAQVELLSYTAKPTDPERRYRVSSEQRLRADGSVIERDEEIPPNSLFLARREIVQYAGSEPVLRFEEQIVPGPDIFTVEFLGPPRERARYVRTDDPEAARKSVAQDIAEKTPESVREWDEILLSSRGPFLRDRYGEHRDLNILEVGPGATGIVPRVFLAEENGNRYFAVDLSKEALAMQREVLLADGFSSDRMKHAVADAEKALPVRTESQDLIIGYASIGLWGPTQQVVHQFDEFARVLKPGGEVLIGGIGLDSASPPAVAHILRKFELVPQIESDQSVHLLLRKRKPE